MELKPEDRPAFLDHACSSDHTIRREIERLLDMVRGSQLEKRLKLTRSENYRERERLFAGRFGLRVADSLGMKTSAGSLNRALNFRTCPKVRLRCPVMNMETALSEPN